MRRPDRHSRVLRAVLGGALAVGACGQAEDPTNVSVTIDPAVSHQTLVGFGAATAYLANLLSDRTDDIFQVTTGSLFPALRRLSDARTPREEKEEDGRTLITC